MTTIKRGLPSKLPVDRDAGVAAKLRRVLSGQENFTGLKVEGQDVSPFLAKTDGTMLVDAGGIAPAYVVTETLSTTAIRPDAPATNTLEIPVNGLNDFSGSTSVASATSLISTTFTAAVTGDIIIEVLIAFRTTNAETCELALFVNNPGQKSMNQIRAQPAGLFRILETNDPGGDASVVAQIIHEQAVTAGAYTMEVWGVCRNNTGEFIVPVGSASIKVFVR